MPQFIPPPPDSLVDEPAEAPEFFRPPPPDTFVPELDPRLFEERAAQSDRFPSIPFPPSSASPDFAKGSPFWGSLAPDAITEEGEKKGRARSAASSFMQGGGVGTGQTVSGLARLGDLLAAGYINDAGARLATANPDAASELLTEGRRLYSRTPDERERDIAANPITKFGQDLATGAKEAFPANPKFKSEFFTSTIPSSAGQMVPTVAAGMVNPVLAAGQYGLASGQAGAEESIAAGDLADADNVFLAYLGLGGISELALGVPANVVRYLRAARAGGVDWTVARETIQGLMLKGGAREAGQESLEQIGQNIVAQQTFDPNRRTMEGVPESAAAGALLGGAAAGGAAATGVAGEAFVDRMDERDFQRRQKKVADAIARDASIPAPTAGRIGEEFRTGNEKRDRTPAFFGSESAPKPLTQMNGVELAEAMAPENQDLILQGEDPLQRDNAGAPDYAAQEFLKRKIRDSLRTTGGKNANRIETPVEVGVGEPAGPAPQVAARVSSDIQKPPAAQTEVQSTRGNVAAQEAQTPITSSSEPRATAAAVQPTNIPVSEKPNAPPPPVTPKFQPVQIADEAGYGYKVVHETTRSDTPKWQVTTFDENGNPTGHTGNANLADSLREAGYFKRDTQAVIDQQPAFFDARRAAETAGDKPGEFAYVSAYRPFTVAPAPLKGTYWRNAGNKAVVFSEKPLPMEIQNSLELTAVSKRAFDDLIAQKTKSEFPNAEPSPVTETPVIGGAEADLPEQQREQSRRNNAAQAESIRKELEAAKSAPPAETPKSSTQLTLPPADAVPFTQFAQSIPASEVYHKADETGKDDFGIETQPHITVLYGLTQHDTSAVAPVITPKKPITVTLGKLSVFESKDYDVLKVDVSGADIRALNKEIAKLPNEQTFPKYTPHLTIAYLKKGEGAKYVGDKRFEGMKLTFPSVTFSPPSEIRATTGVTEIPFSQLPAPIPAAERPATASKQSQEFDRLIVEHGPELGWNGDYDTLLAGQREGGSTMAIEGKKRYGKALQGLRKYAASAIGADVATMDSIKGRAEALPALKTFLEGGMEAGVQTEIPEDASTDFLPPEPEAVRPPLAMTAPESVEEQTARMATEESARKAKADKEKVAAQAAAPLRGTAGDLGQGDLLGAPDDLFAPPAPKPQSLTDQAISKIEDLQKKLRGSGSDVSMGVPKAILDLALEAARLTLKAGKTVAEAIEAAIAKIRESVATFDEAEVRDTLNRELAAGVDENLQHEEEPRAQVAGIESIGQMRPVEHLPEILAAVREKVIDARKPVAETLEQAWRIARELTDPSPEVRAGHALKYHQTIGGADAGLVTLKQEIMLVGLKQALAGDDSLLRYTFDNSADFQTSVGGGATSVGRALRGEQGEFYGALYKSLRDIFGDQKLSNAQIASALDRDTFFDLIAGLKDMKLSPEEISTVLETGKTPEGDTLRDILEREGKAPPAVQVAESAEQVAARILDRYATSQSDTLSWTPQTWNTVREVFKGLLNGDATHDEFRGTLDSLKVDRAITESLIGVAMREVDIRKQLVVVRARERRDAAWQREMENLATQGQRSAETALRNLELKNAGAEWLKPGTRNRVRDILNKAFSPSEPILQDPRPWIDALRDELEAAGVEFSTATQLAQQVYQARETQWVNANLRAMERAAETGSIRSLVEAVIADPYRAQNSPEWLRKTAVNWFMSNGLTPERAEAAYKLFEPQFKKALADAQEKVARQVLEAKRKDPRTIKELVTLIRSGVLDPSRNWLDQLAERRGWKKPTAAQYGKFEELDEQLAQPDLSPLERRDIVEQQHRIIRHLGKLDGQAARTVAESFLASLLTGFRSFTVQLTAAVAGLRDVAIGAAFSPTNTIQLMRAMKNAVVNNFKSQLNYTWQKGISAFHVNEVEQNFSQLERLHEDVMAAFKTGTPAQKAAAAAKYLFAQQRWVLRALNAMDSASAAVIREYKLAYYSSLAFKEAGLDTRMISELLDAQQAIRQAEYDKWINAGLDHDRAQLRANATVDRTTRDLLSGKGVEDRLINAVFQSAENDSYGVVGRLSPGVQETGKGVSEGFLSRPMNAIVEFVGKQKAKGGWSTIAAQTMFGFVAIPWRATRFASTFMWYGLVRGGIDNYRTKRGLPTFWKQSYGNVLQSRARLREAIAGTVVGIAAGLLLANTSDDDPDDDKFKVFATGAGPNNKNLKDAWIKRGFQPYALNFKINGRIVSIPLTRVGEFIMYPFIIASAIDDAKWKQKERALTGKPPADPISLYAATLVGEHLAMMGQRGLLQTGGQLYQSMQQTGSFGKGVARLAAGTAAGVALPFKQLLSSISDMFVGPLDNSSAQAIVANAFPIVGLPFQNKAVNRFGDQMYDRSWYGRLARTGIPVAFQVDRAPENQKLYTLLASDGVAPPELRRGTLENKYGPLTDEQFADFAKKSGALLKQSTLSKLSDLQRATPAEVKSFLSKSASQADKTAAAALGLQPLTKPETEASTVGASLRAATSTATGGTAAALPSIRTSTGNLRASLSRRTRTPSLGRVRSSLGRTRLATIRVPRLRSGRLRASLSRPRAGRFSVRSRMAGTRRPRARYA